MKCGDVRAHANEKAPELQAEKLPATHPKALELSTSKVPTLRWACACEWARYEVDWGSITIPFEPEQDEPEGQLGFRFGTPGCASRAPAQGACGAVKCGRCP